MTRVLFLQLLLSQCWIILCNIVLMCGQLSTRSAVKDFFLQIILITSLYLHHTFHAANENNHIFLNLFTSAYAPLTISIMHIFDTPWHWVWIIKQYFEFVTWRDVLPIMPNKCFSHWFRQCHECISNAPSSSFVKNHFSLALWWFLRYQYECSKRTWQRFFWKTTNQVANHICGYSECARPVVSSYWLKM